MTNIGSNESELYKFLNKYGIKTPEYKSIGLNEVISFSSFPAVIKIESSKVVHKSDVGGVILNLNSIQELEQARGQIIRNLEKHNIRYQVAELGKVDVGGGGTIAYIIANKGADVIDCGVPVLSMHAPYEVTSKFDIYSAYKTYKAFWEE